MASKLLKILCLDPRPKNVVLIGHSQGGAASAHACTDRVVASAHIHGLLMLGSENPQSHDGMSWVPKVPQIEIVHATGLLLHGTTLNTAHSPRVLHSSPLLTRYLRPKTLNNGGR